MTKGGNEYILDLDPTTSIHDVKQFFQIFYSLNSEKITIIYHNRILSDSETLSNFIDMTLPGLFIVSEDIQDLNEEIEFNNNNLSPKLDINLNLKPKQISQKKNKCVFHRLSNTEALSRNLLELNSSKVSKLSDIYPDNFTSFKVVLINSKILNSYENFSSIPVNTIITEFSKTIGEALKPTISLHSDQGSNSLNNFFIIRSKTLMSQHSRLYQYNLHQSSTLFLNCESLSPKSVNLIVILMHDNPKMRRQISYSISQETNVLDFKKIVARDFFKLNDPNSINLIASQTSIMVDDRQISDYNFVNNSYIRVIKSDINNEVTIVLERPSSIISIKYASNNTIRNLKKYIAKHIKIDPKKIYVLYKCQMIQKEYQVRLKELSNNKVFSIQLRTSSDPVYGIEFETGVIYYLDITDDQSILDLKIKIRDIMSIPISHICLIYNNKILKDEATMGELSISYFSIITCKKQGFYENMQIKIKTPSCFIQHYVSPHTYVTDVTEIIKQQSTRSCNEKFSICIPILLFDQSTKMSQIEHCQDTKFVLCEKRQNSFFVTIKTDFNDIFYLPVFPEMTVRDLISIIQLLLNIDLNDKLLGSIRLMCYGIVLRETYTLGQYQIKPDYIIDAYLLPF